eukprot:gnl/TRDRNA2_/TRDRNA2_41500_c0_seq1.p1 gnl/TRDRNA2_/TRDRNA2_41500_c0~~gnl/TRDRNA2_/TRDRNA2_41500_c0_seq1.p1  ORF type:complete len:232 (-),score=47.30 gnl/TRDRNA2_/TRDRNA2_41500_c0_seq1:49-744(-)
MSLVASLDSVLMTEDDLVKASWEDYTDKELLALASRGELEVVLKDKSTRLVRQEWFDSLRGTPLYSILFDVRWGGDRGALDCPPEVFDDLCTYLLTRKLPDPKPGARRRRLRWAADFYCIESLAEALDEAAEIQRALRRKEAEAAEAEKAVAAKEKRQRKNHCGHHDDQVGRLFDQYADWELQRGSTKAFQVHSMLRSVKKCCDEGGPRTGLNAQKFVGKTVEKRYRYKVL